MKIVFATNNHNKIKEVQKALPNVELVSLKSIGCLEELAEDQKTLEGNAQQKLPLAPVSTAQLQGFVTPGGLFGHRPTRHGGFECAPSALPSAAIKAGGGCAVFHLGVPK